jgi:hypothetical protein
MCTISHVWKNKMHICNIVSLCFSLVNCVPPPDGSIWYWLLPSPPPSSSVSVAEVLRLDSWYFGLCPRLRVSSSLPITLFCFFLCLSLSWPFVFACLCVCHQQSHRPNQQEIIYQLFSAKFLNHHLLWPSCSGMGVSLWVSSSSSNGSALDRPFSIQSLIKFCAS